MKAKYNETKCNLFSKILLKLNFIYTNKSNNLLHIFVDKFVDIPKYVLHKIIYKMQSPSSDSRFENEIVQMQNNIFSKMFVVFLKKKHLLITQNCNQI